MKTSVRRIQTVETMCHCFNWSLLLVAVLAKTNGTWSLHPILAAMMGLSREGNRTSRGALKKPPKLACQVEPVVWRNSQSFKNPRNRPRNRSTLVATKLATSPVEKFEIAEHRHPEKTFQARPATTVTWVKADWIRRL